MNEDEMYDIIRGYEESERDYHERNIELENENDKLRELAKDMLSELRAATQYDAGGGQGAVHEFADRMRELGVKMES